MIAENCQVLGTAVCTVAGITLRNTGKREKAPQVMYEVTKQYQGTAH